MKTYPMPHDGFLRRTVFTASSFACLASLVLLPSRLAAGSSPGSKDYVLFVGTDLAIKQDGQYYHVVRAGRNSMQIERNHQLEDVRSAGVSEVKVTRGVKLSSLTASISEVKTDSYDRAAAQAQFDAMRSSMMLVDEASSGADRLHGQLMVANGAGVDPNSGMGAAITAAAIAKMQQDATSAYTGALPGVESMGSAASTFYFEKRGRTDSAEVDLSFDVSAPQPIENAYVVVVANYGSDDKIARQISVRELKRIDTHAQRVRVSQAASVAGLPFKRFDFGLYAGGQEIATNLSDKRMPLTADQAYQFFLIDYLSSHTGATTPPVPMLMTPRTDFRRQIQDTDATQTIYAQVDKTGSVLALSTDESGASKPSASVETALRQVRFMPALQNGAPVDGRVKITLSELLN